ncbi:hypothetical protein B0H34DRAFT_798623 [Crassisporium funariophilum]|nr:hypothetical protein B0H34DRAFT_798623 [Crassisporium funariophilum]
MASAPLSLPGPTIQDSQQEWRYNTPSPYEIESPPHFENPLIAPRPHRLDPSIPANMARSLDDQIYQQRQQPQHASVNYTPGFSVPAPPPPPQQQQQQQNWSPRRSRPIHGQPRSTPIPLIFHPAHLKAHISTSPTTTTIHTILDAPPADPLTASDSRQRPPFPHPQPRTQDRLAQGRLLRHRARPTRPHRHRPAHPTPHHPRPRHRPPSPHSRPPRPPTRQLVQSGARRHKYAGVYSGGDWDEGDVDCDGAFPEYVRTTRTATTTPMHASLSGAARSSESLPHGHGAPPRPALPPILPDSRPASPPLLSHLASLTTPQPAYVYAPNSPKSPSRPPLRPLHPPNPSSSPTRRWQTPLARPSALSGGAGQVGPRGGGGADVALSKWFLCGSGGAADSAGGGGEGGNLRGCGEGPAERGVCDEGLLYYAELGVGGPKALRAALMWHFRAREHGNPDAPARLFIPYPHRPPRPSPQERDTISIAETKLVHRRTLGNAAAEPAVGQTFPAIYQGTRTSSGAAAAAGTGTRQGGGRRVGRWVLWWV